MNTKSDMTVAEAAGYIIGLGVGLVWRYNKFFIILFASVVLFSLVRIRITYDLPSNSTAWTIGLIDGLLAGAALLAAGIALWFSYRKSRR